ncbi:Uncharacterised protein [Mycobacterium tuberculosis]|uniref:Uncharacterized protein n=1 Tax=Mycobacterium tuberculosis TaxID=1773 RepID=A0A0T9D298_MYCTX|nr:Uncharacterised protein [Mycobacterium tuberculosis]CFS48933.1 Uncharacterised protein [Mycobacterium tuberculosis]CKR67027.1 Uncharacterised protein [Mycobacterium tuberculosis]CKR75148.1 Uncharacterised protein [Mycobacterium tuberculosis]CKS01363.1 Uncharacterised protein [Mycobacterium tuberculosis]
MIGAPSLADVVQQRAKRKQVGTCHPGGQWRRMHRGLDHVSVNRPLVGDVARRKVANGLPFRQQPAPEPGSVERFDGSHRGGAGGEHN